jgi:cytochrome c oxidase assembly protein subunit 15
MTTAVDGIVMLILLGWAVKIFLAKRDVQSRRVLYTAAGSMFFVITEAAVGAGLVLTGNTAEAVTDVRPLWAMGHLINTFILLTFLTLTAWFADRNRFSPRGGVKGEEVSLAPDPQLRLAATHRLPAAVLTREALLIAVGVLGLLFVGLSGSLAALSSMLFPSETLAEGIAKDFSETSNLILRLRLSHPILSILTAVYLIFLAGWLKAKSGGDGKVTWWSNAVSLLVIGQVIFGGATLLTLGPIVMQLGHLLLADMVWIGFVLLVANYFANGEHPEL